MENVFVGIDVSKEELELMMADERNNVLIKNKRYQQNKEGFSQLLRHIKARSDNRDILVGLEATGKYHINLVNFLVNNDIFVRIYNPLEISTLRARRLRMTKTDKIDAEVIVEALKLDLVENTKRYLATKDHLKLKELIMSYQRLVRKLSSLKRELRLDLSILCPGYEKLFQNILSATSREILWKSVKHTKLFEIDEDEVLEILKKNRNRQPRIENMMLSILSSFRDTTCPDYLIEPMVADVRAILKQGELLLTVKQQFERRIKRVIREIDPCCLSVVGVGEITAAYVLGILGDVRRFPNLNAVTAYAGLDPVVNQSGKLWYKTGHISRRGNKYLRTALINGTKIAINQNPVIGKKYHEMRSAGKSYMTAVVSCARKLLHIIYSVEKHQKKFFIPEYV
jgi:transposase